MAEHNEYYVYFNKDKSYYTSYNVENNRFNVSDIAPETYYPKLYNFKEKKFTENIEMDKKYVIEHQTIPKWTITNGTKEISGYLCIKAEGILKDYSDPKTSFKVEAWFTPEVAFPIGPNRLVNLPGAVVYAVIENYLVFKLEKIVFNENSIDLDNIQLKEVKINLQEYVDYLDQKYSY